MDDRAMIRTKRIYDPASKDDGFRVLVDRVWPRGVKKSAAAIDLWLKDIAPSTALRTWFAHDPAKWSEFRRRYHAELAQYPDAVALLQRHQAKGPLTLLFAARDPAHNNAVGLKEYLESRSATTSRPRRRQRP
jgi:uncharacterized protein YeaO (DUF488 family)